MGFVDPKKTLLYNTQQYIQKGSLSLSEIQSLARGLQFLDILEAQPNGLGITEAAELLDIDKSSASRILKTLANYGYAEQDSDTRRYTLGARLVQLGQSILHNTSLRQEAKPFMTELVEITGECAHIAILAHNKAFYLDQVESPATLRVSTGIGTLAPLHCTALGKVLLAFGDYDVPITFETYTPRTITSVQSLDPHLAQARQRGYAIDDEEYNAGVRCIAVPVYGVEGELVGALGISGPTGRVTLEKIPALANIVMEVGERLTDRLSFRVTT